MSISLYRTNENKLQAINILRRMVNANQLLTIGKIADILGAHNRWEGCKNLHEKLKVKETEYCVNERIP